MYEGNNMRSMMGTSFEDSRLNKRTELNENMSIDVNKSEDEYGVQIHSLSKQSFSGDVEEE
ncbi:hypothetical protein KNV64_gp19 [Staphylococcus phage vB_SauP_EBHT]|uniref:Uncharacterized protein n=1 Tax=Staphylococcus phage Portland TaxID=2650876 RepID=A0A7L8ZJH0_9CAUD|nr:hypothetical protein KNV64_gp19 [Staphylococcus phage vB_SauP_EBHT]QOI69195.1 hypothetical protein EBHT_00019 [Staphylococcus phage Portland]